MLVFRIEIDASDNNNTTALHYAAKYVSLQKSRFRFENYKRPWQDFFTLNTTGKDIVISYSS